MRLLHTSDWHLGHTLHDLDRGAEHDAFLAWLLDQISQHAVDALLVTGDIFDQANPPAAAQERYYGFLADCCRRFPSLDVVILGGNHDSAARLDAPNPLLRRLGLRVVGGVARDGVALAPDAMVVPLRRASGEVGAWVAAVPFLRPSDLPRPEDPAADPLVDGVRTVYKQVVDAARSKLQPGQSLVVTGHCYLTGGEISELSERRILGGNQHALPIDVFPADAAYVALGHLHRAQQVGRPAMRYAGSPIPLALDERTYNHQVVLVDLDGDSAEITPLPVPRAVDILRLPTRDAAPIAEVLLALAALPPDDGTLPRERWPFLELSVRLPQPEPGLRRQVDEALAGKAVRIARIGLVWSGTGAAMADVALRDLAELDVDTVFLRMWERGHAEPPAPDVMSAFHELLAASMLEAS